MSSYAYGNGLAVLMYIQSEGELELFSDLTVNLPGGYGLKPHEAFVSGDFTRDKPVSYTHLEQKQRQKQQQSRRKPRNQQRKKQKKVKGR